MSRATGFSVRIFMPAGEPEGLRIVEKSNWTGQGLVFPRSLFSEVRQRPELSREAVKTRVASIHAYLADLRRALVQKGVLEDAGSSYRLAQAYSFNSPSTAAGVLLGRSANGRVEWKDEDGRSLKELQEGDVGAG